MNAALIDHIGTVAAALFLLVWGGIKGDYGAVGAGIGLLGVKAGVAVNAAQKGGTPPAP